MNKAITLTIGTTEDAWKDRMYLDLVLDKYEVPIDNSTDLIEMSGEEFVQVLGRMLNTAKLFARELNLPISISIDDFITESMEEFDEQTLRNVRALLKETKGV